MCGICGFNWANKSLIKKMINILKHRGPDDSGYYVDDKISIGHTRLSIIDLSEEGRQPIHNELESLWIIFDGVIYNYKEIKELLEKKGHKFYTNTVAEVVIHSYEENGPDCLKEFNGQFSFCIFDSNNFELFLARDKFGIKPLYYYHKNNQFIFASEIKAILSYDLERKINKNALREYFTYRFTFAPNTILQNINKLEPGYYLKFNLQTQQIDKYKYHSLKIDNYPSVSLNEIPFQVFKLLKQSVKMRLRADVPICTFLSGGIDSSVVTYLASLFNKEINTYSVGFENSSELNYAKIVSDHLNTNHHEYTLKNDDVLKNIDKLIYHMDEPIGDAAFLPVLYLSHLVSKNFKVVLTGDCGDEVFGGYDRYKMSYYGKKLSYCIPRINYQNEILNRISKFSNSSEKEIYFETIRVFPDEEMKEMQVISRKVDTFWMKDLNFYQKMQYYDLHTSVPEDFNMKSDKMSLAYGLQQRFPFGDEIIIKFGLSLPTKFKLHFWNEKFILKKTFSKILPKITTKRRKMGFNSPMDDWFKTILKTRFLDLLREKSHNLYQKEFAIKLLNKLNRSGMNYKKNFFLAQKCWTILVFEEWYKQVF